MVDPVEQRVEHLVPNDRRRIRHVFQEDDPVVPGIPIADYQGVHSGGGEGIEAGDFVPGDGIEVALLQRAGLDLAPVAPIQTVA